VLDAIGRVYEVEAGTKAMSERERLDHHQKHSGPVMIQLRAWIEEQFQERQVEPNSALGKAFQYLLNHYENLNHTNPWDYLLTLLRNREDTRSNPDAYLPWNYRREEEEVLESQAA
jgi:hypothetical protein